MKILLTGAAGFIGYHLANRLVNDGFEVVGLDSINDYYEVSLKYGRLKAAGIAEAQVFYNKLVQSVSMPSYSFIQLKLEGRENIETLFKAIDFDIVINLAAQAGVRYSITNPHAYIESNLVGFANLLECCRHHKIKHLIYASSSSVYGLNDDIPFSTDQKVDHPISLYAATKKSNELMAHVYSHLYALPTTGLRFFTVYGPWGRPDMAMFLFTKAIIDGKPIQVFNNGEMERDFTYIDDIVDGVARIAGGPVDQIKNAAGKAPYRVYNIGNSKPVKLTDFIDAIEDKLGKKAEKIMMPLQPGDVLKTFADTTDLKDEYGYDPLTPVKEGVGKFIDWYIDYFNVKQ